MELGDKSSLFWREQEMMGYQISFPKKIGEIDSNGSMHMRICVCTVCLCARALVCEPVLLVCNMNVGRVKWWLILGCILNKGSVL